MEPLKHLTVLMVSTDFRMPRNVVTLFHSRVKLRLWNGSFNTLCNLLSVQV